MKMGTKGPIDRPGAETHAADFAGAALKSRAGTHSWAHYARPNDNQRPDLVNEKSVAIEEKLAGKLRS
jgi:hypothetical protein